MINRLLYLNRKEKMTTEHGSDIGRRVLIGMLELTVVVLILSVIAVVAGQQGLAKIGAFVIPGLLILIALFDAVRSHPEPLSRYRPPSYY